MSFMKYLLQHETVVMPSMMTFWFFGTTIFFSLSVLGWFYLGFPASLENLKNGFAWFMWVLSGIGMVTEYLQYKKQVKSNGAATS